MRFVQGKPKLHEDPVLVDDTYADGASRKHSTCWIITGTLAEPAAFVVDSKRLPQKLLPTVSNHNHRGYSEVALGLGWH